MQSVTKMNQMRYVSFVQHLFDLTVLRSYSILGSWMSILKIRLVLVQICRDVRMKKHMLIICMSPSKMEYRIKATYPLSVIFL